MRTAAIFIRTLVLFAACRLLVLYLNLQPEPLFTAVFALGLTVLCRRVSSAKAWRSFSGQSITARIAATMFSAFFAISIVLGKHIVMTGSSYAGTVAENYIAPYGLMDLVAFVDVAVVCLYLISCLFGVLHGRGGVSGLPSQINLDGSVFGKRMTACALCLLEFKVRLR